MMVKKFFYFLLTFTVFYFTACSLGELELKDENRSLALPLAYGTLSIADIAEESEGLASLRFDGDGKTTLFYSGNVLRDNASKIFPPVPGFLYEFPIADTNSLILLPVNQLNSDYRIDKGIFGSTNLSFRFKHDEKELVKVIMRIPSVTLNGKIWEQEYVLDFANDADGEIITSPVSVLGWNALPADNYINFQYFAYDADGNRIKLNTASMKFDVLQFAYLEGYFGNHVFDIKGDFIKINLFDNWVSGGVEIINPIIKLNVDNVFGFPVRSKVNELYVKTLSGEQYNVESPFVTSGIDFNYPNINEVGQLKRTEFLFTGENSNVGTLFKDKIVQVAYDFDAVANPEGNQGQTNFFTADSYFSVSLDVELPLQLKSNLFTLSNELDLTSDLKDFDEAESGKLKIIADNGFPLELKVGAKFLNENGQVIEVLEGDEGFEISAASINNGKVVAPAHKEYIIDVPGQRMNNILNAKKVKLTASFDTSKLSSEHLWIYKEYGLDLKIGAIVNTK